jgi:hypothetical protein
MILSSNMELQMTDLAQAKLVDVIEELQRRRTQLIAEPAVSSKPSRDADQDLVPKSLKARSAELRRKELEAAERIRNNGTDVEKPNKPEKTEKKRGRPKGSKSKAKAKRTEPAGKVSTKTASSASNKKTQKPGRTLKEELFSIAKANGGRFRVNEASQQLVKSGRYDDKARAAANIHAAIKYYTDNFVKERSERGLYRVKGA